MKSYAISKKNLSQSDQRFKSNARLSKSCPIGDRVLVREAEGVHFGSNYLFLVFLICTDSHSKKLHGFRVGSISESFFRYRYSVIPSFGNLSGIDFFIRKKSSWHITLYMVEKILDRAI